MTLKGLSMSRRMFAYDTHARWKSQGVPEYVTGYEAYRLTGGKVGAPRGMAGDTFEFRLLDLAVKFAKLS